MLVTSITQDNTRLDWIDTAKGVMIVLVVFGHALRGLAGKDMLSPEFFSAVDSRLYAFHMPAFFMLSGWFFLKTVEKYSFPEFFRRRAIRLLWPLLIWTYIFLGFKLLAGNRANDPVGVEELWILPIPGILHLWFIWALFVINVAFASIKPFIVRGRVDHHVFALFAVTVFLLNNVPLDGEIKRFFGGAIYHGSFFLFGCFVGACWQTMTVTSLSRLVALVMFALTIAVAPHIGQNEWRFMTSLVLSASILLSISALSDFGHHGAVKALNHVGQASMAIFLAHTIFSAALREALLMVSVTDVAVHLCLATLIGVVGPLALFRLAQRTRTTALAGF